MAYTQRKVPRFTISFTMASNELTGRGVNISTSGLGFLTEDEIIPADEIPFTITVRGALFTTRAFIIHGTANLLHSTEQPKYGGLYYNGFEFIKLDDTSRSELEQLIHDLSPEQEDMVDDPAAVNLANYAEFRSTDILDKADYFSSLGKKQLYANYKTLSSYIDSACASTARVAPRDGGEPRDMIMMGSNNYLGLTTHPEVIQAGVRALEEYGSGNGAGAMVGGTLTIHTKLEQELADFVGKESAMVFNSGYSANIGLISGLVRAGDAVINDQFNHASIIDGGLLSAGKIMRFEHNNMDSLKQNIERAKRKYNGVLIAVDGVYSTNGDFAPLDRIVELAQAYECRLMVDEAHGLGVVGHAGAGACEQFGVSDRVDMIMGTLSKSLAGVGGFVAARAEVIEYLRYYARSYLFSTNIPPAVAGSVRKALEILQSDPSIRRQLQENIAFFRAGLDALGLPPHPTPSAIVAIQVPDLAQLSRLSSQLYEQGLFHNVMAYPAVPVGQGLLRFGIMATHTRDELQRALDSIDSAAREQELDRS